MVGERTQGFYINRTPTLFKNVNSFLQRAQCGGDLCDLACGKRRMMRDNAKQRQLRVKPPFLSAFLSDSPALA
jgi:hypothetical protein